MLPIDTFTWTEVPIYAPSLHCPRLSHSCTVLTPTSLLLIGGHDGTDYASSLVILHLTHHSTSQGDSSVSGRFEEVKHAGVPPSKRGYHTATLNDGKVTLLGGFDGKAHFEDTWILDVGSWLELESLGF